MIATLILAAGASRRMQGRDKLLERIEGQPLLRRCALRALAAGGSVWITLPPVPHPRYDVIDDLDVHIIPVPDADEGMNASLRRGLAALPPRTEAALILLADMPDITTDDISTVKSAVDPATETLIWRAQTQSGQAGHPTVFSAQLFDEVMALRGDAGGREVAVRHAARTRMIPLPGTHARTDLDTPEAWADWRAAQTPTE